MSDKKIVWMALGMTIVMVLSYILNFIDSDISSNPADWGAFGNYAAVCVGTLSIALIYITYREQRRSNEITRTEQHIATMTKTLGSLVDKNISKIEIYYTNLCEHFKVPFGNMSDCEYDKVAKVCTYYYSSLTIEDEDSADFNHVFQYMKLCLDYILQDKTLTKSDKQLRITELSCILSESIRVLFLFWSLVYNHDNIEQYYKFGIFILDDRSSDLLVSVIAYLCAKDVSSKKEEKVVDPANIILDNYPKEQFFDTYNRLNIL